MQVCPNKSKEGSIYTVVMKKVWGYKRGKHMFILLVIYSKSG